ncbi:ECF RNA polymerase sigma factor SigK [Agromyces mediolanus]|uniref:ECF RNA polymerase sigma factor SigK n=1 Tax=Agromyces mediolanus TaxID=41986 RepID=UPI0038510344
MLGRVSDDVGEQQERSLDALLGDVATGDRAAFGELYDRTAPRVFGLVRRILVDAAQAEEVTQDVFLEAWQNAARFDAGRGAAVAWLLTIAHRRAVDRVRSAQAAADRDLKAGVRELASPQEDVAERVELRVEHERVSVALAELSEAQRTALAMAYYEGKSQSEIAVALELPLGTVKTRLRDGMIRLRHLLGVTS